MITIRGLGWVADFDIAGRDALKQSQLTSHTLMCSQMLLELVLDLSNAGLAICIVSVAVALRSTTDSAEIGLAMSRYADLLAYPIP